MVHILRSCCLDRIQACTPYIQEYHIRDSQQRAPYITSTSLMNSRHMCSHIVGIELHCIFDNLDKLSDTVCMILTLSSNPSDTPSTQSCYTINNLHGKKCMGHKFYWGLEYMNFNK